MRFYLDTEFNGFGGELISLALVGDDDSFIYLINPKFDFSPKKTEAGFCNRWVYEHVIPILHDLPDHVEPIHADVEKWGEIISAFIYRNSGVPQIFADWPSDMQDLCRLLITGPGEAVHMEHQTHLTILRHLDVYPTSLPGAVQHNAWWDAMALRQWVREASK